MLLDLVQPLKSGAQYPLTLTFRDAGAVTVQVQIREQP
jgi:copper(I)-binding protein